MKDKEKQFNSLNIMSTAVNFWMIAKKMLMCYHLWEQSFFPNDNCQDFEEVK